jgi:hypothetical protein
MAPTDLVSGSRNNLPFVPFKMGRQQGAEEGAYLNRYVTEEQSDRRPIFNATIGAAASRLFLGVAHSLRINQICSSFAP